MHACSISSSAPCARARCALPVKRTAKCWCAVPTGLPIRCARASRGCSRKKRASSNRPIRCWSADLFKVVIPARYASARLPGKALLPLAGKPMVQWVYERACAAQADEVVIATDDERIAAVARAFARKVIMTEAGHVSGTDRVAEVAGLLGWRDREIVVNAQGDEPLLPPQLLQQVAALLAQHAQADIATLATPIDNLADFLDPNVVKLVTDGEQRALYFSRAPIPWTRDGAPAGLHSP